MKIVALGIDKNNNCCIIKSKATFDELKQDYDKYKIEYDATDWSGRDDLSRTLELRNLKLTGRIFLRNTTVEGYDYDHGHTYPWTFHFNKIAEVVYIKDLLEE